MDLTPRICSISELKTKCEDIKQDCNNCLSNSTCDYCWIFKLWLDENKLMKADSLLGPAIPIFIKNDLRSGHILTMTGKYDFCCFNVPKKKDVVVISDIYVHDSLRGEGISKKIINYLMTTYDRDIFAKCVRGTSAENFWSHLGKQLDANDGYGPDFYEHRPNKRDLGWYIVENKNKKAEKIDLF